MAAAGHFGCSKITFDCISDRSAILDVWKSLSIAILAISDRYRILLFFSAAIFNCFSGNFWSIGHIGCPKFTFDGIFGHFRSIWILIMFLNFAQNGRRRSFWMSENNFQSHFLPFQIDTKLFFKFFFDEMAASGHFGWDDNVNYRTRPRYLDELCMCQVWRM